MDEDWRKSKTSLVDKFVHYLSNKKEKVIFSVGEEEERIKASVDILSTLSPVFEKMFNETWKGQEKVIPLPDCKPKAFQLFLKVPSAHSTQFNTHVAEEASIINNLTIGVPQQFI